MCSAESSGKLQAEVLVAIPRNTSSGYYDLYYSCNVCGDGILWTVDREDAASLRITSTPGDVDFYRLPGDSAMLRYVSIVLSRRVKHSGHVCLDSVLVVSQPEPFSEKRPVVQCSEGPHQQTVRYPSEIGEPVIVNNGTVAIEYLLGKRNIVVPGSNYTTHMLGCRSRGIPQTWKRNEMVKAGYNTADIGTGAKVSEVYSSDSSAVRVVTVLLERQTGIPSDEVYSIFVWTDIASTPPPANVTCVSSNPSEYAYTSVPMETLTTTIENTLSDSTFLTPPELVTKRSCGLQNLGKVKSCIVSFTSIGLSNHH